MQRVEAIIQGMDRVMLFSLLQQYQNQGTSTNIESRWNSLPHDVEHQFFNFLFVSTTLSSGCRKALVMKRKGVAPQHGACDVWLDASALKKRKVQMLTPLKVVRQRSSYLPPTRSPLACTKQTTISTFFSALRPGEKTSSSKRIPTAGSSSTPLPKGHEETQLEKWAQDLCFPQPASAPAQSDAGWEDIAVEKEAPSESKDLFFLDCLQPLQEKELLGHPGVALSPLRERNRAQDPWRSKNQLPFPPVQNQQGLSCNSSDGCLMEDSENVDPHLKGCSTSLWGLNQSAARLSPNSEVFKSIYEVGHKESQAELSVPLFSQDSEGYRVISHRFIRERGKPPLQKKPLWNRGSPSAASFNPSQQFHYDSLFTQDSEGFRVIKH